MEVLFLEWNSYCNPDMIDAFERLGYQVTRAAISGVQAGLEEAKGVIGSRINVKRPAFVFSFNYIINASIVCEEVDVPYVSWVYDSPYIHVYSYTVLNPCNHIFLFDYALYDKLAREGIRTVHYLPMAVNERRLQKMKELNYQALKYRADIAFVGSLYSEPKHRLFDKFQTIEPYAKGYLDGITAAQKLVYGYNFLEGLLEPRIVAEMEKAYPTDPNALTAMKPEEIYAEYVLNRHVTATERREILGLLGQRFSKYDIRLYTNDANVQIDGVRNMGPTDYYDGMPYVFMNSKINLNISLRSIRTGIPLRAFDIMGCGGFLLTNYQQEFAEYFDVGTDFVYYENYEDLMAKTEYYLTHEREREEIAENGAEKVRSEHTMVMRAERMVEQVLGDCRK